MSIGMGTDVGLKCSGLHQISMHMNTILVKTKKDLAFIGCFARIMVRNWMEIAYNHIKYVHMHGKLGKHVKNLAKIEVFIPVYSISIPIFH